MSETKARCFDGSRPGLCLREVHLDEIVDLLPLTHGEGTIEGYRSAMLAGDRFPPIAVFPMFGRYVITDGHKRFQAARPIAASPVVIEVWSFRRLLQDQWRQVRGNARKNARIVTSLFVRPSESWRLLRTTLLHWVRVARCLLFLVAPARAQRRALERP